MSAVSEFIAKNFKDTIRYNPDDEGNLIGLPYPYTTPCANEGFTEMYYWDTYFTNVGLIAEGNVQQAKNNADNVRFLIHKYGFMPNATAPFISATHSRRFFHRRYAIYLRLRVMPSGLTVCILPLKRNIPFGVKTV